MTSRYAIIGNPVGHSKSPLIHALFAHACDQDMSYVKLESPLDQFESTVRQFIADGGRGMNITAPFKLQALSLATDPTERAQLAGAANTFRFDGERIYADNVDGLGLVRDIQSNLGVSLTGRRVLILGAGGAARGALMPVLAQNPSEVVIANRTLDKATDIAAVFASRGRVIGCGYPDLQKERFDVVINTTSASLKGDLPAVPDCVFSPDGLAYDVVYSEGLTPFQQYAQQSGVQNVADGLGMLIEQAAEAFFWWRGVRPATRPLIERFAALK